MYPLLAPLFALAALAAWSRWARAGGALRWWIGVACLAVGIDATRVLLQRVEDDAGGPGTRAVTAGALLVLAFFAARAWSRLGPTARDEPQGPGPAER